MTIGKIRDSMAFEGEYTGKATDGRELTIRVYATKRAGTYGYQFSACAWMGDAAIGTSRTGGYGYDKAAHCFTEALHLLGFAYDSEPCKLASGGNFKRAFEAILGEDATIHHAHG